MSVTYSPLHILGSNGWTWLSYEKDYLSITNDYYQYTADFLGATYRSTVVAIVSQHRDHLETAGHYGVLWLEAVYENDRDGCYSYEDMIDMQTAIINAEENLLRIGMPFIPDYKFLGKYRTAKIRRNEKLRKMYGLDEIERIVRET